MAGMTSPCSIGNTVHHLGPVQPFQPATVCELIPECNFGSMELLSVCLTLSVVHWAVGLLQMIHHGTHHDDLENLIHSTHFRYALLELVMFHPNKVMLHLTLLQFYINNDKSEQTTTCCMTKSLIHAKSLECKSWKISPRKTPLTKTVKLKKNLTSFLGNPFWGGEGESKPGFGSWLSLYWGWDGHPTFNDGILIKGPYKPLRNWVDEFIPYYMEIMGVDRPWHTWIININMSHEKNPPILSIESWIVNDGILISWFMK